MTPSQGVDGGSTPLTRLKEYAWERYVGSPPEADSPWARIPVTRLESIGFDSPRLITKFFFGVPVSRLIQAKIVRGQGEGRGCKSHLPLQVATIYRPCNWLMDWV